MPRVHDTLKEQSITLLKAEYVGKFMPGILSKFRKWRRYLFSEPASPHPRIYPSEILGQVHKDLWIKTVACTLCNNQKLETTEKPLLNSTLIKSHPYAGLQWSPWKDRSKSIDIQVHLWPAEWNKVVTGQCYIKVTFKLTCRFAHALKAGGYTHTKRLVVIFFLPCIHFFLLDFGEFEFLLVEFLNKG